MPITVPQEQIELKFFSNEKYKIIRKINSGSCGIVYLGKDMIRNVNVAIKIEKMKNKKEFFLYKEFLIYQNILYNSEGFPRVYYYEEAEKCNVLVMDLLGPSLQDLFILCKKKFSLKTSVMLAIQMLNRLSVLHSKCYIHRDIKPDNFLIGADANHSTLHLVDLGLSKLYCDPDTHEHIPFKGKRNFCGSIMFSSVNSFESGKQSRRDDLESIGYIIIYFIKGKLPWSGIRSDNRFQYNEKVSEKKMSSTLDKLCVEIPEEIKTYLHYCRFLKYSDDPDYEYLEMLMQNILKRFDYPCDNIFDWTATHKGELSIV